MGDSQKWYSISAGVGRKSIAPKVGLRLCGSLRDELSTAIHNEVLTSAVVFESKGEKVVIVAIDAIIFSLDEAATIRGAVAESVGVGIDRVFLNIGHTHAVPAPPSFSEFDPEDGEQWSDNLLYFTSLVQQTAAAAQEASANVQPVTIAMEDQFRNRHDTARMRGDVVVLVYAERTGAEASQTLGRKLHVRFHPNAERVPPSESAKQPVIGLAGWPQGARVPDVRVMPVACLSEIPGPFHMVARSQFRSNSPHLPVWMDFQGQMKRSFGLVPGVPNVAVIDAEGRLHGVVNGRFDDARIEELAATIDQLRRQTLAGPRTALLPPIR